MENEDSTRFTDSLGQDATTPGLEVSKDLAVPSELEEPINLSVKKPPLVPAVNTSMALQQYRNPKGEVQVSKQPVTRAGYFRYRSGDRLEAGGSSISLSGSFHFPPTRTYWDLFCFPHCGQDLASCNIAMQKVLEAEERQGKQEELIPEGLALAKYFREKSISDFGVRYI